MAIEYEQYLDIYEIREQVAKASGRYDLVDIDEGQYCNNGVDFFIHQGQRSLERRLNIHPTIAKWFTDLTVGQYICQIANLRSVQEVWVLTSTTRKKLIKYDHRNFLEEETTKAFDSADRGEPTHYYPTGLKIAEGSSDVDATTYGEEHEDTFNADTSVDPKLKGVIVWPPVDQTYTIEVGGLYYDVFPEGPCDGGAPSLVGDSPIAAYDSYSNYWMQEYPNLLIMATMQQIEFLYKGSKAAKRWDEIIEGELVDIEKDAIEEEVANVTKMLG